MQVNFLCMSLKYTNKEIEDHLSGYDVEMQKKKTVGPFHFLLCYYTYIYSLPNLC
jgi:hypothetical protein